MDIYIGVIGGYMTTLSAFSSMLYLFACEASHAEPHQHNTHQPFNMFNSVVSYKNMKCLLTIFL